MNVCDWVEVVERNQDGSLSSPAILRIVIFCEKKSRQKKFYRNTSFTVMFYNFAEIRALTLSFMVNGLQWNYADIRYREFQDQELMVFLFFSFYPRNWFSRGHAKFRLGLNTSFYFLVHICPLPL